MVLQKSNYCAGGRRLFSNRSFIRRLEKSWRFGGLFSPHMVVSLTSVRDTPCFVGLQRIYCYSFSLSRSRVPAARRNHISRPHKASYTDKLFRGIRTGASPVLLLETRSSHSRPFVILPVSAVSKGKKLVTDKFFALGADNGNRTRLLSLGS